MRRIFNRQTTESFSTPWIPVQEFASVMLRVRRMPNAGETAVGSFAVLGSNDQTIADGLWADSTYQAVTADQTDITSSFVLAGSTLSDMDRLNAVLTARGDVLPLFVRLAYTRTSGSVRVVCDFDATQRGVDDLVGSETQGSGSATVPAPATILVDVRQYTPVSGGEHAPLSNSNFTAALEAALADALVKSTAAVNAGSHLSAGPMVYVPDGIWEITHNIAIAGTGISGSPMCPGIQGAGISSTTIISSSTFSDAELFTIGGDQGDSNASYTFNFTMRDLTVMCYGGSGTKIGVHIRLGFHPQLINVHIEGFQQSGVDPRACVGLLIDDPYTDIALGARNNQHVVVKDCWIQNCTIGAIFRSCTPLCLDGTVFNQNPWIDYVVDGCQVSHHSGTLQGGGTYTEAATYLAGGQTRVVSGWNTIEASGSGAAVGTASGDVTTVTGLTGVTAAWVGKYLELQKSTNAYDGSDKVSGIFLIEKYVSATSVKIRKGSSHASTSSLTWKLRVSGENHITLSGQVYHEGTCPALVGQYGDTQGSSSVSVRDCVAANCEFVVETWGTISRAGAAVVVENCVAVAHAVRARYATSVTALSTGVDNVGDLDMYSREGLVCRDMGKIFDYVAGPAAAFYSGNFIAGGSRLRSLCLAGGANLILDPRVSSSITKSGADVSAMTDLANSVSFGLAHAGKFPQYSAADATLNSKPSISMTGNATPANTAALVATVTANKWPSYNHSPAVLFIGYIPSAVATSAVCRVKVDDGHGSQAGFIFNEAGGLDGFCDVVNWDNGGAQYLQFAGGAVDTNAHAFITGGAGRPGLQFDKEDSHVFHPYPFYNVNGWVAGYDKTVCIGADEITGASPTRTLVMGFFAVFPNGLTYNQRQQILDAAANEFALSGR